MKKVTRLFITAIVLTVIRISSASAVNPADSARYYNWFNLDMNTDSIPGIGTNKAYNELLKNKNSSTVIVAVIDGGVDIRHRDLADKIWVNEGEIPDNGIDDDHNGFIDDVNGWNFLGGPDGKNLQYENYEATRIYKKYKKRFSTSDTLHLTGDDLQLFLMYQKARAVHFKKLDKAMNEMSLIKKFELNYFKADSIIKSNLKKDTFDTDDINKIDTSDSKEFIMAKTMMLNLRENGFKLESLKKYEEHVEIQLKYHFNINYNPRTIVGDNPDDLSDSIYGNNDVIANTPDHGTFVSGIIAADRNNHLGINGIAGNVKIMPIRAVPDGDERDKDVANAIKYAVNNGAKIINMSFGKDFSPHKDFVDQAVRYAAAHDVLLVHAAGNESEDTDVDPRYPSDFDADNQKITDAWLNIGATSMEPGNSFVANFSNYGKRSVDFFAPGVDIYSLMPDNKYDILDGTSFSSPMTAGAAALIKSYYPEMSAVQIRNILISSVSLTFKKEKVLLPSKNEDKKPKKVKFGKLSSTGGLLNVFNALALCEYKNQAN